MCGRFDYFQVYFFATNMKVIEDAYTFIGREAPDNYKKHFAETFYDSLEDKANFHSRKSRRNSSHLLQECNTSVTII